MTKNNLQKLTAAIGELREHQENARLFAEPDDFDPAPTNALGIRAHAIQGLYDHLSANAPNKYLRGLGYVREQLIAARDVLNANGKKKYEAYIKNAVTNLSVRFQNLKPHHLDALVKMATIPFRRSAVKDRREISDSLCWITGLIADYRYHGLHEQFRGYAQTIIRGIDTEEIPPMIASLIIQEVTALINAANSTGVLTFVGSGLTHEEYWRYIDPEEYLEVYEDGEIPNDASSLEELDIYSPQLGIARQSLWYGHDNYVDDFIVSLAGGLFHTSDLSKYLS